MRLVWGGIAIVAVALGVLGCEGFLGIGDATVDVTVTAEARQADNFIGYAVENRSADTIFLDDSPRAVPLERRDAGEWRPLIPDYPVIDILILIPIGPGEDFTTESQIDWGDDRLSPGEYRYRLGLTDKDGDVLPAETRTSNTIRIH